MGMGISYHIFGVIALFAYNYMVFERVFLRIPLVAGTTTVVLGFVCSWFLLGWYERHAYSYFMKPYSQLPLLQANYNKLARSVLNTPYVMGALSFAVWIVFGCIAAMLFRPQSQNTTLEYFHFISGFTFAGQITALLVMYHGEMILTHHGTLGFVLQENKVSEVEGVIGLPVYMRLCLLFLTTSVMPTGHLFVVYKLGGLNTSLFLWVFVFSVCIGIWQTAFMVLGISWPIGRLASRFEQFRNTVNDADSTMGKSVDIWRADSLGRLAEMYNEFVATWYERNRIRYAFGRFVNESVVDDVLAGDIKTGGLRVRACVLFSDIRGFTPLSESVAPEEIVEILNEYLEEMVNAITETKGLPNKFIGDGILAVWGIPQADPNMAKHAVETAFSMLERLKKLNTSLESRNIAKLEIGIGIHVGELIAGNIGSSTHKMEYTVIGDTVNTSARIEAATKNHKNEILISQETYDALPLLWQQRFHLTDPIELKGKNGLYALYGS